MDFGWYEAFRFIYLFALFYAWSDISEDFPSFNSDVDVDVNCMFIHTVHLCTGLYFVHVTFISHMT